MIIEEDTIPLCPFTLMAQNAKNARTLLLISCSLVEMTGEPGEAAACRENGLLRCDGSLGITTNHPSFTRVV